MEDAIIKKFRGLVGALRRESQTGTVRGAASRAAGEPSLVGQTLINRSYWPRPPKRQGPKVDCRVPVYAIATQVHFF